MLRSPEFSISIIAVERSGHYKRDCPSTLKRQHHKRNGGKSASEKTGNGQCKWCSYHRTTGHSDAEWKAQQKVAAANESANVANVCTHGSLTLCLLQRLPLTMSPLQQWKRQQLEPLQSERQVFSISTSTLPERDGYPRPSRCVSVGWGSVLALMAAPMTRTEGNSDFISWLPNSGPSRHYVHTAD